MAPPVVQNLNDIVSQVGQAYAPEKAQIDSSIAANDTSGAGQIAGVNAAKDQAFTGIDQTATNRGMAFSGFSPDAQAKYLGTSYLPALSRIQSTIAATRGNLLAKKAGIDTQMNTQALAEQNAQKSQLNSYNNAQTAAEAKAYSDQLARENALQVAGIRANATTSAAATRAASVNPAKGYTMTQNTTSGGYDFKGPNNRPVTAAQYANITGTNISDLLASSGDAGDKNVLKDINSGMTYQALNTKYPWVFGGV